LHTGGFGVPEAVGQTCYYAGCCG